MAITTQLVDRLTHNFNTVAGSAGTATFSIDLSTYANGTKSLFELRANTLGVALNGSAYDGFKRRTTVAISWNSSGHTRLAATVSGNTNPVTPDFTNDVSDAAFNNGGTPSTAAWTVSGTDSNVTLTVTNQGSASNDFLTVIDVFQTSNQ